MNIPEDNQSDKVSNPKDLSEMNALIINKLKSLSSQMTAMENKVGGAGVSPHRSHSSTKSRTDNDSDKGKLISQPCHHSSSASRCNCKWMSEFVS